ncbi:DUF4097 family beta strand repeat-containing protein [Arthrobacter castelli]|uniref:DUF4097 family beta strand repeat-containing protein n=1 Tax=Arthrobacter castelli TaxID=271431 RepID=UPI0004180031|nr:DUF4097 family beta strand repeat-containing protein [Arthrobacter castelli]
MKTSEWTISEPETFDVDEVTELKAGIVDGRIDILVHDSPQTRVEVSEVSGEPIEVSFEGGTLKLKHRPPLSKGLGRLGIKGIRTGSADEYAVVSIAVPEGTAVSMDTVNGDGLVCGTSRTSLDTVTGSIMADDTSGHLTVNTVSGEAIVRHHTGTLASKSVSGEVTASGFLDNIRINTVSGDISLDVLGTARDLGAKSVSGDLTVRLPEELGIDLSAATASGTAMVDDLKFSSLGKITHTEPGTGPHTFTVRTNSVSGNIALFHAPGAGHRQPGEGHRGGAR